MQPTRVQNLTTLGSAVPVIWLEPPKFCNGLHDRTTPLSGTVCRPYVQKMKIIKCERDHCKQGTMHRLQLVATLLYHEQIPRCSAEEVLWSTDQSSGTGFRPLSTPMNCLWTVSTENRRQSTSTFRVPTIFWCWNSSTFKDIQGCVGTLYMRCSTAEKRQLIPDLGCTNRKRFVSHGERNVRTAKQQPGWRS